jgi:UDPglucose 6-dehydrogenase
MAADLKYIELCARQNARVSTTDKLWSKNLHFQYELPKQYILDNTGNGVQFQILSNLNF